LEERQERELKFFYRGGEEEDSRDRATQNRSIVGEKTTIRGSEKGIHHLPEKKKNSFTTYRETERTWRGKRGSSVKGTLNKK